jgi:hypothetical protein
MSAMTKSITPRVIFLVRPRIAMLSHRCSALASSHDNFARQLRAGNWRQGHSKKSQVEKEQPLGPRQVPLATPLPWCGPETSLTLCRLHP